MSSECFLMPSVCAYWSLSVTDEFWLPTDDTWVLLMISECSLLINALRVPTDLWVSLIGSDRVPMLTIPECHWWYLSAPCDALWVPVDDPRLLTDESWVPTDDTWMSQIISECSLMRFVSAYWWSMTQWVPNDEPWMPSDDLWMSLMNPGWNLMSSECFLMRSVCAYTDLWVSLIGSDRVPIDDPWVSLMISACHRWTLSETWWALSA